MLQLVNLLQHGTLESLAATKARSSGSLRAAFGAVTDPGAVARVTLGHVVHGR